MTSSSNKCSNITLNLIKLALYAFTTTLLLVGISLIVFSVWYMFEGNQYHLDTSISFSVSAIAFTVGIVLLTISACGLTGVIRENSFLTKLFLSGMMFLMLIQLVSVILIYAFRRKILRNANSIFEGFITSYSNDDDIKTIVDTIQSNLHCCGITSAQDWNNNMYYSCSSISTMSCGVPPSCCKDYKMNSGKNNFFCGVNVRRNNTLIGALKSVYIAGCKYEIYSYLEKKQNYAIIIFITSLIPQFFALLLIIAFIFLLNSAIDREKNTLVIQAETEQIIKSDGNYLKIFPSTSAYPNYAFQV